MTEQKGFFKLFFFGGGDFSLQKGLSISFTVSTQGLDSTASIAHRPSPYQDVHSRVVGAKHSLLFPLLRGLRECTLVPDGFVFFKEL